MNIDQLVAHIIASRQHNHIYHFTDDSNFESIRKNGLCSKTIMRQEGWWPKATGGNQLSHDLDDYRGISSYVSLCLTRNHPMKFSANAGGRLPSPRYLGINPAILKVEGVLVAFGVANANDTEIRSLHDAVTSIDIEVIYSRTDWKDPSVQSRLRNAEKVEILIPNRIPVDMILSVF